MKRLVFFLSLITSICAFSTPTNNNTTNSDSTNITVGVIGGAPPFADVSKTASGNYFFGFSIDIMNTICKLLQAQCTYRKVDFANQLSALDAGEVDLLLLAEPYAPFKLDQYATSLPYVISKGQFVATKDSSISTGAVIRQFKIGAIQTTYYDLLKKSPYGSINQIIPFNSMADLVTALMSHQVDLIFMNSVMVYAFMNNNMYAIKPISKEVSLGEGYGIVGLPDKADLIKKINKAILTMQMDGSYLAIFSKYYNRIKP